MTSRASWAKRAAAAAGAAFLLAVSLPLWSSASYVVPRGASMEPRVSDGDLAVVHADRSYRVGDIAAYRNTALHRVVVHRIVAVDGGIYTFKGDANSFVDPQQVRREQIVGSLSVSLPMLGGVLLWLTHPVNALLLAAVAVLLYRDRRRLLEAVRPSRVPAVPAARAAAGELFVDDDRLVAISDMSFPHELAVAEVVRPESLLELAARYDRPVLHDEAAGALFVVESSMLFRCVLDVAASEPTPLTVVREPAPEPTPIEVEAPAVDVLPAAAARHYAPRHERERRHNWPSRKHYGGRRKPSPHGRDWSYAAGK